MMFIVVITVLFISAIISTAWVIGIHNEMEYKKENTDYKPDKGWLDWDESHTEGEL